MQHKPPLSSLRDGVDIQWRSYNVTKPLNPRKLILRIHRSLLF